MPGRQDELRHRLQWRRVPGDPPVAPAASHCLPLPHRTGAPGPRPSHTAAPTPGRYLLHPPHGLRRRGPAATPLMLVTASADAARPRPPLSRALPSPAQPGRYSAYRRHCLGRRGAARALPPAPMLTALATGVFRAAGGGRHPIAPSAFTHRFET